MRDEIVIVSGGMLEIYATGLWFKIIIDFPNPCQGKRNQYGNDLHRIARALIDCYPGGSLSSVPA